MLYAADAAVSWFVLVETWKEGNPVQEVLLREIE